MAASLASLAHLPIWVIFGQPLLFVRFSAHVISGLLRLVAQYCKIYFELRLIAFTVTIALYSMSYYIPLSGTSYHGASPRAP